MSFSRFQKLAASMAVALLVVVGCDSDSGSEDTADLLSYVPADSPYVFSFTEPTPKDFYEVWGKRSEQVIGQYLTLIREVVAEEQMAEGEDAEEAEKFLSIVEGLGEKIEADGMESFGLGYGSTGVIYGNGLLPVIRLNGTDGSKFEQTISEIEQELGTAMLVSTIDDVDYRYAGDEKMEMLVAIMGNDIVFTFGPTDRSDDLTRSLLGLTKPGNSMADSGEIGQIADEHDFVNSMVFVVDIQRIASSFLNDPQGGNKELLALFEYDASDLSDACRAEFAELAGVVPRVLGGYTDLSASKVDSFGLIEIRPDLASELKNIVAPVRGLGTYQADLFTMGMSFNMDGIFDFMEARINAIEADPYECEELLDLNDVEQGRQALAQRHQVTAYNASGLVFALDDISGGDIANNIPPTSVDVQMLLAVENPQALLAMGAMFSPQIAGLDIQPDGKAVPLPLPPLSPVLMNAHAAMTEGDIVIALGESSADKAEALAAADFAGSSPWFSTEMDAGAYYEFIGDMIVKGQEAEAAMAQMDPVEGEEGEQTKPMSPEAAAALADVMNTIGEWIDRIDTQVMLTDRGVEIPSTMTTNP